MKSDVWLINKINKNGYVHLILDLFIMKRIVLIFIIFNFSCSSLLEKSVYESISAKEIRSQILKDSIGDDLINNAENNTEKHSNYQLKSKYSNLNQTTDFIPNYPYVLPRKTDLDQIPKDRIYRIRWDYFLGFRMQEGYIYNGYVYWSYDTQYGNGVHRVPLSYIPEFKKRLFLVTSQKIKRALPPDATQEDLDILGQMLENYEELFGHFKFKAISDMETTLHCSGYTILTNPYLDAWFKKNTAYFDKEEGQWDYGCCDFLGKKFSNYQVDTALNYWNELSKSDSFNN